jgi:Glycosyl transferase family 2
VSPSPHDSAASPDTGERGASVQAIIPSTRPKAVLTVLAGLTAEGLLPGPIIVDDTANGAVARSVSAGGITVLRTGGAGSAVARNRGAKEALAEWLLFVDDDVVIPRGFGDNLRRALASASPDTDIFECPIVPVGPASRPHWRYRVVEARTSGGFLSAGLVVRRHSFRGVGGFIGRTLGGLREDTDLGLRILATGARSAWLADMYVEHPIETVNLYAFIRTATFFRQDAEFNQSHPGYLASTGQQISVGPLKLRGFRRRLALITFVGFVAALASGRVARAFGWLFAMGVALNTVHLRTLHRAGSATPSLVDVVRPDEVAAQALWGLTAGGAQSLGSSQAWLRAVRRSIWSR